MDRLRPGSRGKKKNEGPAQDVPGKIVLAQIYSCIVWCERKVVNLNSEKNLGLFYNYLLCTFVLFIHRYKNNKIILQYAQK